MKKINRIRRKDFNRVLITETLPYETPIIFSNDGLYDQIINGTNDRGIFFTLIESLVFGTNNNGTPKATIPYTYKIKKIQKNTDDLRLFIPFHSGKLRFFTKNMKNLFSITVQKVQHQYVRQIQLRVVFIASPHGKMFINTRQMKFHF